MLCSCSLKWKKVFALLINSIEYVPCSVFLSYLRNRISGFGLKNMAFDNLTDTNKL